MPYLTNVSEATIREWAYDANLSFDVKDEKQVFQRPEYVPTLIQLAAAPDCPRKLEIQDILEAYTQDLFLKRKAEDLTVVIEQIQTASSFFTTEWLILWFVNVQYLHRIFITPQRITPAACDKIAKDLLVGIQKEQTIEFLGLVPESTREYKAAHYTPPKYLYIDEITGEWQVYSYRKHPNLN